MNRRRAVQSMMIGAAAAGVPLFGAAKDLAVFREHWARAKDFTLKVASAMPAEAYDFKPTPEMRTYGQLMQHLANNNAFYISRFKGEFPDELKPTKETDKETIQKYMAASFDWCAQVLNGVTEADLDKMYPGRPNAPHESGWDWVMYAFIHTAHHRGYADVYLRVKGITPPRYSV